MFRRRWRHQLGSTAKNELSHANRCVPCLLGAVVLLFPLAFAFQFCRLPSRVRPADVRCGCTPLHAAQRAHNTRYISDRGSASAATSCYALSRAGRTISAAVQDCATVVQAAHYVANFARRDISDDSQRLFVAVTSRKAALDAAKLVALPAARLPAVPLPRYHCCHSNSDGAKPRSPAVRPPNSTGRWLLVHVVDRHGLRLHINRHNPCVSLL